MGRHATWAMALLVAVASCTSDPAGLPAPTSSPEAGPSTTTTTIVPPTTAPAGGSSTTIRPTDQGRLAIVDSAGDIVVMGPDGSNPLAITNTGGTQNPAIYKQPVWSPDGASLSWGQTTGTGFGVGITQPGTEVITTLTTPSLPFYTYWSPSGRYLGVLHNGSTGVAFQIADIEEETTSIIDEDAPFYFSWSPDTEQVVTHAGATRAETLTPSGERTELEPTTPNYLAPQWTPGGVFHVVDDRLVLEDDQGERRPVAEVSGFTLFVANTAGTLVAVQSAGNDGGNITAASEEVPPAPTSGLSVIDIASGDSQLIDDSLALGFFWSRDGRALLALMAGGGEIVPTVWTAETGSKEYSPYRPPDSMLRETFPFFPQYAQSVSFWSPDASAFGYAGEVDGEQGVWIQRREEDAPTRVSDGSWVAWSAASADR